MVLQDSLLNRVPRKDYYYELVPEMALEVGRLLRLILALTGTAPLLLPLNSIHSRSPSRSYLMDIA